MHHVGCQMMDWGSMGGFMWLGMLTSAIFGVALIALVVAGIVWLVRQLGADAGPRRRGGTREAIDELRLRYARGEVDRETFLAIRADLERDSG